MKKIVVVCEDAMALTLSQLLLDQSFAFSVEPFGAPADAAREPAPRQRPGGRAAGFGYSTENRGLMAVLRAGAHGREFTFAEVGDTSEQLGLSRHSGSAALSKCNERHVTISRTKGVYQLTEKGTRLVATLGADQPLPAAGVAGAT